MRIAIFDLDGTLVKGESYAHLLPWLWQRGWRRLALLRTLAHALPPYLLRNRRLSHRLENQERWTRAMARLLKGASVAEVRLLFREASRILPFRPDVMAELRARQEEGCRVYMASNSISPWVEQIAHTLGVDGWVASPTEVRHGRYTGRLAGPACNQEHKLTYLTALTGAVTWADSYAYGDGHQDLPMLEQVGNPVTVDPDEELHRVALERSWRVIA